MIPNFVHSTAPVILLFLFPEGVIHYKNFVVSYFSSGLSVVSQWSPCGLPKHCGLPVVSQNTLVSLWSPNPALGARVRMGDQSSRSRWARSEARHPIHYYCSARGQRLVGHNYYDQPLVRLLGMCRVLSALGAEYQALGARALRASKGSQGGRA